MGKAKGYRVERKIRKIFEIFGWITVRAGASLGEADLICLKAGRCLLLQIKSTRKRKLYYYGYSERKLEGFPFYLVVDFGYGRIRIAKPRKLIGVTDGEDLKRFLNRKTKKYK